MIDRNELWAEAEDLADLIIQCPEIETYREAEFNLKNHPNAQAFIRRLRELNDEIGEFISRKVPEQYYQHLTDESESVMAELEKIPEVAAFQSAQDAVNALLQSVTNRLAQAVTKRVTEDGP